MRSKICRWGLLSAIASLILAVLIGTTFLIRSAHAEGEFQVDAIKQNAYYKVVYQNLKKCYFEMKTPLTESSDNTWASFDAKKNNVYFSDDAVKDDFLQFPYLTGGKNQSSCPGLIMGWKTNWAVNLFTGTGSYGGLLQVNKNATVPGADWNVSVDKYATFLQDIGYSRTPSNTAYANAKCFYLKLKTTKDFENLYDRVPAGTPFETQDFCVNLSAGSDTVSAGNIFMLAGRNDYYGWEYDAGHLDDQTNAAFIYFKNGDFYPKYMTGAYTGNTVLDATLSNVDLFFIRYNSVVGEYQLDSILGLSPDTISTNKQAENGEYCHKLGYIDCAWEWKGLFYNTYRYGRISPENGTISYGTFKSRLADVISKSQEDGAHWFDLVKVEDYTPTTYTYTRAATADKFFDYFLIDVSKYNDGEFTAAEKYMLYYTYLKDYYNVSTLENEVEGGVKVAWLNDDHKTFTNLYVYMPNDGAHSSVINQEKYVLNSSGKWDGSKTLDWYNIALLLAEIDVKTAFDGAESIDPITSGDLDADEIYNPGTSATPHDGDPRCYDEAGPMGWVLCPLVTAASDLLGNIYGWIEKNYLEINAGFFNTTGESSVSKAWGVFRDLANVFFVILIIVVIFSQVTGVGIDNYGIKKIMPRIIIAAILMNLSFIICSLLADLSNITGNQLNVMLSSGFGLEEGAVMGGGTEAASFIVVGGLTLAALVALFFVNPGLIVMALVGLCSAAISIFFLWIILVVRKAAIVLAVVISPLAFVCYLLPNTEKWFKRWISLMGGLLLLYPLCGLVIGGGHFAAKVLSGVGDVTSDPALALSAMLIQVIPYFFIPTLLKRSLSAIGNVGAKLSGLGRSLGSSASKGIKNTDAYKEHQLRARAGIDKNGNETWRGRMLSRYKGLGSRSLNKRRARAGAAIDKINQEDVAAASFLGKKDNAYDEAHGAIMDDAKWTAHLNELAQGEDKTAFYAAIETYKNVAGESKMIEKVRDALEAADLANGGKGKGFMAEARRAENLRDLANRGYLAKDARAQNWARRGGGLGKDAMLLTEYEKTNGSAVTKTGAPASFSAIDDPLKDSDIPTLTKKAVERGIADGSINREMARRIMQDENVKIDDPTRLMLTAWAVDGQQISKNAAEQWTSGANTALADFTDPDDSSITYHLGTAAGTYLEQQAKRVNVVQDFPLSKDPEHEQKVPVHVDWAGGSSGSSGSSLGGGPKQVPSLGDGGVAKEGETLVLEHNDHLGIDELRKKHGIK